MPIHVGNQAVVSRIYLGGQEADHKHIGDSPSYHDRQMVPRISSLTVTPDSFVFSPTPPPRVLVDWTVSGEDSVTVQEVVPYFADNPLGVVTTLTPSTVVNDGGVSLELASSGTPFGDHYGYLAANTGRTGGARGRIDNIADSLVLAIAGHRSARNSPDNFHISWTGMPTSGSVYGRWVPNTGNHVDFTMNITDAAPTWTQWAPGISFPQGTAFYEAGARNVGFAGAWNSSTGLPAGRFFLYEDAARTRQINLRSVPISDGSSLMRQLPHNANWTHIRYYSYVVTATNARGKSVRRANVTRVRVPTINYFRMRPGSFSRDSFNNSHRRIVAEFEVDAWPRPALSLTYAPGNQFQHPLRLTAADPRRRTVYDDRADNPDLGRGDEQISILLGSGEAMYRLTATNQGGSTVADFSYTWPI